MKRLDAAQHHPSSSTDPINDCSSVIQSSVAEICCKSLRNPLAGMASNDYRDLRRLAKRYRIHFKGAVPSGEWPAAHKSTFENIRKIGAQSFDGYCAVIDIRSDEQPWREQTKHRAEYLAKRAAHLFNQQRNEAGWRFSLENDVLKRFSFEVAW